jgi:hypothetical protein
MSGRLSFRGLEAGKKDLLFVNKKKQKNFILGALARRCQSPQDINSFLLLFFEKEALS